MNHFLLIKIPQALDPMQREEKYAEPLQEALEGANVGFVNGGGTKTNADNRILYCYLDVELTDLRVGQELIANCLHQCGAPEGTTVTVYRPGKFLDALTESL
jgi:hypothetical protein